MRVLFHIFIIKIPSLQYIDKLSHYYRIYIATTK